MEQITPAELAERLAKGERPQLLDVREPWEFRTCSLPGSIALPMRELPVRLSQLDPEAEVVVICHHGVRSLHAAMFLERQGFSSVLNLAGGLDAWARSVDPAMPVY